MHLLNNELFGSCWESGGVPAARPIMFFQFLSLFFYIVDTWPNNRQNPCKNESETKKMAPARFFFRSFVENKTEFFGCFCC